MSFKTVQVTLCMSVHFPVVDTCKSSLTTVGMIDLLSKYQPRIAELYKPLRDLLSSKTHWSWGDAQQQAFSALKQSLASTPTLAHYDAHRATKLSSDASSYRLGAVLLQKQDNDQWRPVAYASRAMSPTEQRYAQIEKEALGITWASERFADYLIGLKFHIETDHTARKNGFKQVCNRSKYDANLAL